MWYSFLSACVIVGTQSVNQKDLNNYHCHKDYIKPFMTFSIQQSSNYLERILPTLPNIFTAISCIKFGEHITSHDMLAVIIFLHATAKWRSCTVNVLRFLRKNQSREGKQKRFYRTMCVVYYIYFYYLHIVWFYVSFNHLILKLIIKRNKFRTLFGYKWLLM